MKFLFPPHVVVPALFVAGMLAVAQLSLSGQNSAEAAEDTVFARAQQAEKVGDYGGAEQIYQQVLREHPGQMAAELNLGLAYYMDRRYADSSSHLLKALQSKPDLFPALMVAGVDFVKLGNPRRAVPLLRQARELRPADEYVNHNLAGAEYLAGDYLHACADYTRYLALPGREKDSSAWYGLGEVSLLLGQRTSAQLGKQPSSNPYRLRLLAMTYREQHEWGLALARLRQLEAEPGWQNQARLQIGEIDLHQSNFVSAAAEFRQVLTADPDSARAHFGLGVSLLLDGKTEAALPELVKGAQDPWLFAHPESLASQMASTKLKVRGLQGVKSGSALVDTFLVAAASRIPANSDERFLAFHRAYQEAVDGAHQANERRLEDALRAPPSPQKLMDLTASFLEEGDSQAASDALNDLPSHREHASRLILQARVKAAQNNALGTVGLLLPFLETRENDLSPEDDWQASTLFQRVAEMALAQVLMIAPNSVYAHLLKAQADDAHRQTEAAIREFRLAVQVSPDDADTHYRLGEALWRAGHFREAVSVLNEGLKLDPHNAASWYEIGNSYVSLAEPGLALPYFTEALKLNPGLDAASKDLGTIYLNQGKARQAIAVLSRVAPRDGDGSIHYLLFRAYLKLGDKAHAAACLKRFQELKAAAQNQDLFNAEIAGQQQVKTVARDK